MLDASFDEDWSTLRLAGELDESLTPALREALLSSTKQGARSITVDLAGVAYLTHTAIGAFSRDSLHHRRRTRTPTARASRRHRGLGLTITGIDSTRPEPTPIRVEPSRSSRIPAGVWLLSPGMVGDGFERARMSRPTVLHPLISRAIVVLGARFGLHPTSAWYLILATAEAEGCRCTGRLTTSSNAAPDATPTARLGSGRVGSGRVELGELLSEKVDRWKPERMYASVHTAHAAGADAVEVLLENDFLTQLRPVEERCDLWIKNTTAGPLSIGHASFGLSGDLRGAKPGVVGVARARAGRLSYTYGDNELRWAAGDLFVAVDPASEYVLHVEDADVDHTMLDVELFDQVVEMPVGHELRIHDRAPLSPRAAASWVQTWRLVTDTISTPSGPVSDLVVGQAARLLAAVTLTCFPNNAVVAPTSVDRRDAHPRTVRRAIAFIETNPDLDLTVIDIANAASVSPRALQLAFGRHLGTTPMAYLRRVRLDRARAELVAATSGDGTTVTGTAARWGWARPSRFAAAYRAAYGRHPSADLTDGGSVSGR